MLYIYGISEQHFGEIKPFCKTFFESNTYFTCSFGKIYFPFMSQFFYHLFPSIFRIDPISKTNQNVFKEFYKVIWEYR